MTQMSPLEERRLCGWCHELLSATLRSDAKFCSKRCRQAAHRFRVAVGTAKTAAEPMRLAIADPPYPGKAYLYEGHPDYADEVDHGELIWRLVDEYDGWALATSEKALGDVLAITARHVAPPSRVRVAAWFRGARGSRSAWPSSCWEPVIYWGGRQICQEYPHDASSVPDCDTSGPARRDALIYTSRARLTDPKRVIGAKPAAWCRWVFDLLGARRGDILDDLYPGSGGISRAWELFTGGPDADG